MTRNIIIDLGAIAIVAAAALSLSWIGYQGWSWDDAHYVQAAEQWARSPPYVGDTHWELRLGFVLPLAGSLSIFGYNETALVVAPIAFYLALLAVVYAFVYRLVGRIDALSSALVVAASPLMAAWATTPRVAIAEAFYLTLSFLLFLVVALRRGRSAPWLIASGVLFGLAWLTRESAIGFGLAFAVFFVLGKPVRRRAYLWLAAGFFLVLAGEAAFYGKTTGNPLYRLYVDLHHGAITPTAGRGTDAQQVIADATGRTEQQIPKADSKRRVKRSSERGAQSSIGAQQRESGAECLESQPELLEHLDRFVGALGRHFDPAKLSGDGSVASVSVPKIVEPFLLFLVEPYYGILFWLLLPASVFVLLAPGLGEKKLIVGLLLLFVACAILANQFLLYLRPLPRYFGFTVGAASIIVGLALARLWSSGWRRTAILFFCLFFITSAVFMESRRGLGLYNERKMVKAASTAHPVVYTDVFTARMAEFFVRTGSFSGALTECPSAGSGFFFSSQHPGDLSHLTVVSYGLVLGTSTLVYEHQAPERWLGRILRLTGVSEYLSAYTFKRLSFPYGTVFLFDVGWVPLCDAGFVCSETETGRRRAR